MRPASRLVVLALAVLATLAAAATSAVTAHAVTLSGTISAPEGQPGSTGGTAVSVRMPGTTVQVAYAQADADGRYEIADLTPGVYDLRFTPPVFSGFGPTLLTNETLTADRRLDLQLVPAETASWSGVVRDSSGAPVPGASVEVGLTEVATDGAGRFSIRVSAGLHSLAVGGRPVRGGETNSYVLLRSQILLEGSMVRDVVLPTADVRVRVVGPSGSPVSGALVELRGGGSADVDPDPGSPGSGGSMSAHTSGTARTAADGSVLIVMPRGADVSASGEVFPASGSGLVVAPFQVASLESDQQVEVELSEGAVWSGVVRDSSGTPVPGASVEAGSTEVATSGDGRFSIRVPSGLHSLAIGGRPVRDGETNSYVLLRSQILLEGSMVRDVVLPTVDVRVRVVGPSESPVGDARVELRGGGSVDLDPGLGVPGSRGEMSAHTAGTARTAADGSVLIVMPRGADVSASGEVFPASGSGLVVAPFQVASLESDQQVEVELSEGAVWSGVVRDSSGTPVPGASVEAGSTEVATSGDGRFSIRVPPGLHSLAIGGRPVRDGETNSYVLLRSQILLEGSMVRDVVLPTVDVRVRVVGPSGSPVSGARVELYGGGSADVDPDPGSPGSGGSMSAHTSGTARTGADGSVLIVMPRGADVSASGSISAPEGIPLPGRGFTIEGLRENLTTVVAFSRSVSDVSGPSVDCDESVPGVAPGTWASAAPAIACTASDDGVGLADPDQASFTVTPDVPDDAEYEGTYDADVRVCDRADNCTELTIPVNVDTKAPTLVESVPADGASYPQGSALEIRYVGQDDGSGVDRCAPASGNAPGTALDTSVPGTHQIRVVCVDEVGNERVIEVEYEITPVSGPVERTRDGYLAEVAADQPTVVWGSGGSPSLGSGPTLHYANPAGATTVDGLFPDDQSARFAGSPTYAYGNGLAVPTGDYTLEAWVRPATPGQTATIMGQGSAGWLLLRGGVPTFRAVDREIQGGAAPADRWTLVVGTWSKVEKVARLYVDGALVASGPAPTAPSGGATFYLGYGEHAPWFAGGIDEPAVFGRALSAARIAAHFAAGSVPEEPESAAPSSERAGSGSPDVGERLVPLVAPSATSAAAREHGADSGSLETESQRHGAPSAGARAVESSGDRARSTEPGVATVSLRRSSRGGLQAVVRCPASRLRTTCRGRLHLRARNGRTVKSVSVVLRSGSARTVRLPPRASSVRLVSHRRGR